MANIRTERINSEIQRVIAEVFRKDISNPLIANSIISVSLVETSSDLFQSKVYISILEADTEKQKQVFNAVCSAKGFIKKQLAQKLDLRNTPELVFKLDNSVRDGSKVLKIIDEISGK